MKSAIWYSWIAAGALAPMALSFLGFKEVGFWLLIIFWCGLGGYVSRKLWPRQEPQEDPKEEQVEALRAYVKDKYGGA